MQSAFITSVVSLALLAPAVAWAHGPVIQLSVQAGRVTTHGLPLDESTTPGVGYGPLGSEQRLYVIGLVENTTATDPTARGWYAEANTVASNTRALGPGFAYGLGGFTTGDTISVRFADGLKRWDPAASAFVDPGTEQFQGFRGSIAAPTPGSLLTTADDAPSAASTLTITGVVTPASHSQFRYRLLGDGLTAGTPSDDGVYLASYIASTSAAGVAESLPYFVLYTKNAAPAELAAAAAFLQANVIPEPSPALAAAAGTAILVLRRRSHKSGR